MAADVLVVIPARLDSSRVPRKALADLGGLPLIERVRRATVAARVGRVVVATDCHEIEAVVRAHGGEVILTGSAHCGSQRVARAALDQPETIVINVQGDQPNLDPRHLSRLVGGMKHVEIGTLAAPYPSDAAPHDPSRVEVVVEADRAVDFRRVSGHPTWLHVGMYGFRRSVLQRIADLAPSRRALADGLEQLSWLDAGLAIGVGCVGPVASAVDTPQQLAVAQAQFAGT